MAKKANMTMREKMMMKATSLFDLIESIETVDVDEEENVDGFDEAGFDGVDGDDDWIGLRLLVDPVAGSVAVTNSNSGSHDDDSSRMLSKAKNGAVSVSQSFSTLISNLRENQSKSFNNQFWIRYNYK